MFKYILKRSFYSLFVVAGVLVITFLLFRVATGDPSSMLLGKNPSPKEIEDVRGQLSSDKPLLFGRWRKTEIFSSADFSEDRILPSVKVPERTTVEDGRLLLGAGDAIVFARNFDAIPGEMKIDISFKGKIACAGETREIRKEGRWALEMEKAPEKVEILAISDCRIASVRFYKAQDSPWDSQLLSALSEIISFRSDFPFVRVFNFGRTLITREKIGDVLLRSVWPSLALMLPIFLGELAISVLFAALATAYRGCWPDRLVTVFSVAGMSVSYVVLIVLGQWFFAYYLGLFPIWGFEGARYLLLPVILGIFSGLGGSVRFYRTVFVNELNKEYLRTALAKGCSSRTIYFRHMMRNAAVPMISRCSSIFPFLFTGSLLLESFFGIPGLGYASVNALQNSDIQMLKAVVVLTSAVFVFFNLLADLLNAWADPRIRLE